MLDGFIDGSTVGVRRREDAPRATVDDVLRPNALPKSTSPAKSFEGAASEGYICGNCARFMDTALCSLEGNGSNGEVYVAEVSACLRTLCGSCDASCERVPS